MKSIKYLVSEMKEEMFSSAVNLCSFVSSSAYDTAWLALIPDPDRPGQPLFRQCLEWIMEEQKEEGFWGEGGGIECLPASLACIVALQTWDAGPCNVGRALAFVHGNVEKLLREEDGAFPRWFCFVFPAMVELAQTKGLNVLPDGLTDVVASIFHQRERFLEMEASFCEAYHPPLLAYLEALPPSYGHIGREIILLNQNKDGSLFQSPSATAHAFMVTGNEGFKLYLESMVQRCGHGGVPPFYPIDEELIKLSIVDRLERLGLSEHFSEEIEDVLSHVYRNWTVQEEEEDKKERSTLVPIRLYKDSLAFRLLRMHGYRVSPRRFCWFLQHEDITSYIEENYNCLLSTLLNVYRATEVTFLGENELEEARSFSRTLLERGITMKTAEDSVVTFNIQREIEHQLGLPWLARLDHLEHRDSIERSESNDYLWMGKACYYRISCLNDDKLLQLAMENYTHRQSVFKNELEEVTRWSRDSGLRDIGFGREKTTYCYLSVASSAYHPSLSDVRMLVCKSAILVTVADDFFDMEGSLDELNTLTEAVGRWDGDGLSGHSKVIFDALDELVDDTIKMLFDRHQVDAMQSVQELWYETLVSWLKEATWSRRRYAPSIDDYIKTSMVSIAVHTMILPACYLINPGLVLHRMRHSKTDVITRLLMISARLLNDMQSYEKEKEDGKLNLVLLYLKENPELDIKNATDCIGKILDKQKKEFLKMTLEDGITGVPKQWRQLHLAGLKAFQMFFNSSNGFDSPTAMINNINKAFYEPLVMEAWKTAPQQTLQPHPGSKNCNSIVRSHIGKSFQDHGRRRLLYYSNIKTSGMRVITDRVFPLRFPIIRHSHKFYTRVLMPPSVTKPLL
ncbi:hypothetical protein AAC387_Pa06g3263 [Persea americana]